MPDKKQFKPYVFVDNLVSPLITFIFDKPQESSGVHGAFFNWGISTDEGHTNIAMGPNNPLYSLFVHAGVKKGTQIYVTRVKYPEQDTYWLMQTIVNGQVVNEYDSRNLTNKGVGQQDTGTNPTASTPPHTQTHTQQHTQTQPTGQGNTGGATQPTATDSGTASQAKQPQETDRQPAPPVGNKQSDKPNDFALYASIMADCYSAARVIHNRNGIFEGDIEACAHSLFIQLSTRGYKRGNKINVQLMTEIKQLISVQTAQTAQTA